MLIEIERIKRHLIKPVTGLIHVGAHVCEEKDIYQSMGLSSEKHQVMWFEADPSTYARTKSAYPTYDIRHALLKDKREITSFMRANNSQASSIFDLHLHKKYHPDIEEMFRFPIVSSTLDIELEKQIDRYKYNFLSMDTQGAELLILKGSTETLTHIDYIYLEVCTDELYKDAPLFGEIELFLRDKGYVIRELTVNNNNWGDAFYVKNN
jgi:FkbM family methyltransferase